MLGLPRLTDELPGTGGALKTVPEDFIVEEIPAYPPSGAGDHLFLTIEKRGITTQEMVRRLAGALGIPPTAVGVAGQKDQQAITRQLASVPIDQHDPAAIANLQLDGLVVLSAARHRHKLRTGHLRGNRFHVVIRGVATDAAARARAVLDRLVDHHLPNYFGSQRFGRDAGNIEAGRALLRGERPPRDRFQRRFLVSAFQSSLFNRYLARRMADGLLRCVIAGEVLERVATGGLFLSDPTQMAIDQLRIEQREIVPTGPMFGPRMFAPAADSPAAAREQRVLDEEGVTIDDFARLGSLAEGTRRPLLARIDGPTLQQQDDCLLLSFALPAGTYATVLLDEIMKAP